jgi:hypothetical protein
MRGKDAGCGGRIVVTVCIGVKDVLGRSDVFQARRGGAICREA